MDRKETAYRDARPAWGRPEKQSTRLDGYRALSFGAALTVVLVLWLVPPYVAGYLQTGWWIWPVWAAFYAAFVFFGQWRLRMGIEEPRNTIETILFLAIISPIGAYLAYSLGLVTRS